MIEVDYNEYKQRLAENMRLIRINHDLKEIIKEAIEYIQDRYDGEALTHTFDKDNVKELLNILQGSGKEWIK